MRIVGIIGAMDEEIERLKAKMEIAETKEKAGMTFFVGKMNGKNVVLVRSGIGKVNAAMCTQILIDVYQVDYVINTGIAGAISKELRIGDIVISEDLTYHDFDYEHRMYFKADQHLIELAKEACDNHLDQQTYFVGRIATGDIFVSASEQKQKIIETCKAFCVEMEGAAIAHVAGFNYIPFVAVRSISDQADEEAEDTFWEFMNVAAEKASIIVESVVSKLD